MDHVKIEPTNQLQPQRCDPCDETWLDGRVALIFSAYRRDDYLNPEVFVEQLKINLRKYPVEIVEYVTDPVTGIQARNQWPPSLAEIVKACEAEAIHREKIASYATTAVVQRPRLPRPKFSTQDSYEQMFAKHGRPFGVFESGRQLPYK